MKHLKKITISNARRFGKDVEIDLSAAANIFLAPNGTGKTTLFEAIEFALTGSIQRLVSPPLSLIRDKQNGVDVRLDFDNGFFCEVNYRKGEEPKLSGDHLLLFPKHTVQDIPFLMRLTHLLEQRGSNWFIQKGESSQAGDLLDKLSVGKELSAISKTKSNTLGAATRTINDKREKKDAHLSIIYSFENKLKERDAAKSNYTLRPLVEISNRVQSIYKLFNETTSEINDGQNLDNVIGYRGLVNTAISRVYEGNQQALLKLSNIESKITLFQNNKKEIEEKQKQVSEKLEATQKTETVLIAIREDLLKLQISLNQTKDLQAGLQRAKELSNKRKEEESKLTATEHHIKSASELILVQRERLRQSNELLEKLNVDVTKFNHIRLREVAALNRQGELVSLQSIIDDWKAYLDRIAETNIALVSLAPQREQLQKAIKELQVELAVAENDLNASQAKLSSLRNASEAILSAVGIISANLTKDQGNCPVCNATYEPLILREKIALALQEIDPALSNEIEANKAYQQVVEQKKQQIQNIKTELDKIVFRVAENEEALTNMQAFINEKCLPKFQDKKTIHEAEEWLRSEKENNVVNLKNTIADRNALGKEPSSDEIYNQASSRDKALTEIQSIETNISTLTRSLENVKVEVDKISVELAIIDLEKLDTRISDVEKEIDKTSKEITNKSRFQEQTELLKKETDGQILDLNMIISKLQGQQNEILTQWHEAGLVNYPSVEELINRRDFLVQKAESIKESLEELARLNEELGRWTAAEKFETLNREIRTICGEQGEQAYLALLKDQEKSMVEELAFITEKKEALDKLYRRIGHEVNNVHQQIIAINPLWITLLKKIVINPRFIETQLNSYSSYNKPHAEVKISLHNEQVSVMDVASEAQATDLQLTFMLSMASSYNWTPWKSLLLDDPTQHHDLVHASGVFDLLRDYIIDQDFQILMGTHDSVQAKFFQRKLQNENVNVKLWRLTANDDGVRAEAIS